jgi:hypothetical protein
MQPGFNDGRKGPMTIERIMPGTTQVELFEVKFHLRNLTNGEKLNLHNLSIAIQTGDVDDAFDQMMRCTAGAIAKIEDGQDVFEEYMKSVKQQKAIVEAVSDHNDLVESEVKN